MHPKSRSRRLLAALLAAASFAAIAAPSQAFVPPSSFILRRLGAKLSGIRGVAAVVSGRVWSDANDPGESAEGKLYLASPDRYRLDTKTARGLSYEIWSGGSRSVRQGETSQTQAVTGSHVLTALFLGSGRTFLAERGVELSVVSLARLDHHLCWAIGAKAGDEKRAQLWVSKDSFMPVRWLSFEGEGETRKTIDWRFDDYDRSDTSTAFPRSIELRVNGVRVLRLAVVKLDVQGVPPESTFSSSTAPDLR